MEVEKDGYLTAPRGICFEDDNCELFIEVELMGSTELDGDDVRIW